MSRELLRKGSVVLLTAYLARLLAIARVGIVAIAPATTSRSVAAIPAISLGRWWPSIFCLSVSDRA